MARNLSDAFVQVIRDVIHGGDDVHVRGQDQKEIRAYNVRIERSTERVLMVPGRNNNVFAQIAETIWVLAGRDDLDFLTLYLPRAIDFSDDGRTWRAAYGPRLRQWGPGVDQLKGVASRLAEDLYSKRAVMSLFDPARDYCETKDVPCNNWLHFLCRGDRLHLNVCVRANDAIWGFSGINVFEWSVLHEIMAVSIGKTAGEINWFAGSMHIYGRHYGLAQNIAGNNAFADMYGFGVPSIGIRANVADLDQNLGAVMKIEQLARNGIYPDQFEQEIDPFFEICARIMQIYNMYLRSERRDDIVARISRLPSCDLRVAVIEYLTRRWGVEFVSELSLTGEESSFFAEYFQSMTRFSRAAA